MLLNIGTFFERIEHREQQFRIEDSLRVLKRTFGHTAYIESFSDDWYVEYIFDGSQAANPRVEEGQQVRNGKLIEMQCAIAVA